MMHKIIWLFVLMLTNNNYIGNCIPLEDQEPNGIHLVYGNDPSTEINVFWWTRDKTTSAIVYYGLIPLETEYLHFDTNVCNYNLSAKGFLARNKTNGKYIQRVLLKNLLPNRLYCYEIQSGDTSSHIYSFRTAAPSIELVKQDEPTNFIIYGSEIDKFNKPELSEKFQQTITNQYKMEHLYGFINVGNIQFNEYNTPTDSNLNFLETSTEIFARLPILPTFGLPAAVRNLQLFQSMFTFMGEWPLKSFWYSFNINGVHFISYSTELFLINANGNTTIEAAQSNIADMQLKWLQEDLKKANDNRDKTPWLVVIGRQPMYCIANCLNNCQSVNCVQRHKQLRDKLEFLFYHYGVDLILESNDNYYERTYPVMRGGDIYETSYTNIEMPIHIALPTSASNETKPISEAFDAENKWKAFSYQPSSIFNYARLEVYNDTHLQWLYMSPNQTLIDSITIIKKHHGLQDLNSFLSNSLNNSDKKKVTIFVVSFLFIVISLISIVVFYTVYKRYQNLKELKQTSHYVNLIESEMDA